MAIITHPFHPLQGQSFQILTTRKIAGREAFSMKTSQGVLSIPREWTDKADPDPYRFLLTPPPILSFTQLRLMANLINDLSLNNLSPKEVDS